MFGRKKKKETAAKKGIKGMDAVVTGAILWWVVASIYGVKKIRDTKQETKDTEIQEEYKKTDKKRWIFARLFSKKQ